MNKKSFLLKEIENWSKNGLIDTSTRGRLSSYTQQNFQDFKLDLTTIFSVLGATVIGLGIFLFIGYNWDGMDKYEKLIVIFSTIIAFNTLGYLFSLKENNRWLAEVFRLLGTLSFGAGIALISQIYHIVDHEPNGVFLFMLGAMITAIIYRSIPQSILTIVAICTWLIMEKTFRVSPTSTIQILAYFSPLIMIIFTWLMCRMTKSFLICLIGVVGFWVSSLTLLDDCTFQTILIVVPSLLGGLYLLLMSQGKVDLFARLFKMTFLISYVTVLFIFTFKVYWIDEQIIFSEPELLALCGFIAISFINALILFFIFTERVKSLTQQHLIDYVYFPLGSGALLFFTFYNSDFNYLFAYLYSAIYVFYTLRKMIQGVKAHSAFITFFGAIAFGIWILARYITFFDSLASSALAFILLGIFLIAVAKYYKSHKEQLSSTKEVTI